jgi:hypothetical protein
VGGVRKPPFGGPEQVFKYLARYVQRAAISHSRLLSLENGRVTFAWKDYADGSQSKMMTLGAVEFIRRFLLHVLPSGLVRIRHFGFLANRKRKQKLALCRALLPAWQTATELQHKDWRAGASPLPDLEGRPVALYRNTHARGTGLFAEALDRRPFMTAMSTLSTKPWPTSLPLVMETADPCPNPSFWRAENTWLRLATLGRSLSPVAR